MTQAATHSQETTDLAATAEQLVLQMQALSAYDDAKKSAILAYAIWWVFGLLGGHRFYLRQYGVAWLFSSRAAASGSDGSWTSSISTRPCVR